MNATRHNGGGEDADVVFAPLLAEDADAQQRLRARLVAAAAAESILDVAYRTVDTPVGSLLLAATDQGLVRVARVTTRRWRRSRNGSARGCCSPPRG